MRGGGKEADLSMVAAIDIGVGDAGEDGEIVAVRGEALEVGARSVVAPARPLARTDQA